MTESDYTRKVLKVLENFRGVVTKHSDRYTKGVPDLSATGYSQTWWCEIKVAEDKPGEQFPRYRERVMEDLVQFMLMRRLEKFSGGRAFYLMYDPAFDVHAVIRPEAFMETSSIYGTFRNDRNLKKALENEMLVNLDKPGADSDT
jgi:hypothetical protein